MTSQKHLEGVEQDLRKHWRNSLSRCKGIILFCLWPAAARLLYSFIGAAECGRPEEADEATFSLKHSFRLDDHQQIPPEVNLVDPTEVVMSVEADVRQKVKERGLTSVRDCSGLWGETERHGLGSLRLTELTLAKLQAAARTCPLSPAAAASITEQSTSLSSWWAVFLVGGLVSTGCACSARIPPCPGGASLPAPSSQRAEVFAWISYSPALFMHWHFTTSHWHASVMKNTWTTHQKETDTALQICPVSNLRRNWERKCPLNEMKGFRKDLPVKFQCL